MNSDKAGSRPGAYAYYVVALLTLAYMLSFLDRILISLVVDPIRQEFGVGDAAIGLLVGFGFVLLYSIMGLPFGKLADRGNRRNLIVFGIIGWSLATMACGLAGSFAMLAIARALVGIGEATLSPAAYSTIADRFPAASRGFAISLYSLGVTLGGGLAMVFGGQLVEWTSGVSLSLPFGIEVGEWRLAFLAVGFLGFPLALLLLATMREAGRQVPAIQPADGSKASEDGGFDILFAWIRQHRRAFITILSGYSVLIIATYMPMLWAPAHFARLHGMSPSEIGSHFGLMIGGLGSAGLILGGLWSDRLARRGHIDAPVRIVILSILMQLATMVAAYLVTDRSLALLLLAAGMLAVSLIGGLQAATLQAMVPPLLRGRVSAVYLLFANLAGMGIGPLLVGLFSEHVFAGPNSLGLSLASLSGTSLVVALAILLAGRRSVAATMRATS